MSHFIVLLIELVLQIFGMLLEFQVILLMLHVLFSQIIAFSEKLGDLCLVILAIFGGSKLAFISEYCRSICQDAVHCLTKRTHISIELVDFLSYNILECSFLLMILKVILQISTIYHIEELLQVRFKLLVRLTLFVDVQNLFIQQLDLFLKQPHLILGRHGAYLGEEGLDIW